MFYLMEGTLWSSVCEQCDTKKLYFPCLLTNNKDKKKKKILTLYLLGSPSVDDGILPRDAAVGRMSETSGTCALARCVSTQPPPPWTTLMRTAGSSYACSKAGNANELLSHTYA